MTAQGALPDHLEILAEELRSEIEEAHGRQFSGIHEGIAADDFEGAAYNRGIIAGLTVAADLVEKQLRLRREIAAEHVPGRVY